MVIAMDVGTPVWRKMQLYGPDGGSECRLWPLGNHPECSRLFDRHVLSLDLAPRLVELGSHLTRCWREQGFEPSVPRKDGLQFRDYLLPPR